MKEPGGRNVTEHDTYILTPTDHNHKMNKNLQVSKNCYLFFDTFATILLRLLGLKQLKTA